MPTKNCSTPPPFSPPPKAVGGNQIVLPMIRGLKVLVVGETPTRRANMVSILKTHGIRARGTTADEAGYRAALSYLPDVVISPMSRPGDPGWWLFKRFHRHPALKWTPALLMKWWEEKDGQEIINISNVFDRLAEALTPIRLLEERIAAGRTLSDRVEITGITAILRVLASAKLTGQLTVNDSWNVFELYLKSGALHHVVRNSVDGRSDKGDRAFLQLVVTGGGHWNFRQQVNQPTTANITKSLEPLIQWCHQRLSILIGPDAKWTAPEADRELSVTPEVFPDVAATLNGSGRNAILAIHAGASQTELETILKSTDDQVELEQALVALVRMGAIYPLVRPRHDHSPKERKVAKQVAALLAWVAIDHKRQAVDQNGPTANPEHPMVTGRYSFQNSAGQLTGEESKSPSLRETATLDLSTVDDWAPNMETDLISLEEATPMETHEAWRRHYDNPKPNAAAAILNQVKAYDSLAPFAPEQGRARLQMWLALIIALLLGALLITGLVMINNNMASRPQDDQPGPTDR